MSAIQQFSNSKSLLAAKTLIAAFAATSAAFPSYSGTIVVTPGSLSGYTYFPPASASNNSGGSNSGEEQDSLQRCLWSPTAGDQTVQVFDDFGYNKDIKLYYRIVGGDGGTGPNGGGGGSSAILKNGAPAIIAEGGNGGGAKAPEKAGFILIKKNDVLRFITGGGGGGGYWSATYSAGGGGGAGYYGGGGGASHSGTSIASAPDAAGKAGSSAPGAAGFGSSMWAGMPGGYLSGGVAAVLGSTATYGTFNGYTNYKNYTEWNYGTPNYTPPALRHPAVGLLSGSPMGDPANYNFLGGAGGGLGLGGQGGMNTSGTYGSFGGPNWSRSTPNCQYNCHAVFVGSFFNKYPQHTEEMKLTRAIIYNNTNPSNEYPFPGASIGGQIITMYQAPTCGILK